jgi:hypothetical protein
VRCKDLPSAPPVTDISGIRQRIIDEEAAARKSR